MLEQTPGKKALWTQAWGRCGKEPPASDVLAHGEVDMDDQQPRGEELRVPGKGLACSVEMCVVGSRHCGKASVKAAAVKHMDVLEGRLRSCRCPLLARVWEADLEACQLLVQNLWLQEAGSGPHAEDEKQADSAREATWTASLAVHPRPHPEEEKTPSQESCGQNTHSAPLPHGAGGQQKEDNIRPLCLRCLRADPGPVFEHMSPWRDE
ncbi:hypothetical protein ACRRTK_008967 [Alexandromys fortis]